MNTCIINGRTITSHGDLVITGNKVYIDGKLQDSEDLKIINITITGNVENLKVDCAENITINGDVKDCNTVNGSVDISGNVNGNITTVNGQVICNNVNGNVKTQNGNIKYKK